MKINIITKNPGKLMAAKNIFDKYKIEVNSIEKEYPEIQASSSLEIAKATALQAAKDFNVSVVREDHSLFFNALGIPGPYTNYIEKKMPVQKLLEIMKSQTDRTGYFEVATVYAEPDGSTKEYVFNVPIRLAEEERGDLQTGWARIIMLQDEKRTIAEYSEEERLDIWNKNYKAIAEWMVDRDK